MKRLYNAFFYSLSGLLHAFRGEAAFRLEVFLCLFLVPLAFVIAPGKISLSLLLLSLFIIIIVELINTAIEAAIDRIGLERHALSAKAKDCASAAVFVSVAQAFIVWTILLW
jgi:diacylglycerol kinase (ATP)